MLQLEWELGRKKQLPMGNVHTEGDFGNSNQKTPIEFDDEPVGLDVDFNDIEDDYDDPNQEEFDLDDEDDENLI